MCIYISGADFKAADLGMILTNINITLSNLTASKNTALGTWVVRLFEFKPNSS